MELEIWGSSVRGVDELPPLASLYSTYAGMSILYRGSLVKVIIIIISAILNRYSRVRETSDLFDHCPHAFRLHMSKPYARGYLQLLRHKTTMRYLI